MREIKFRIWSTEPKENWYGADGYDEQDWANRMRDVSAMFYPLNVPSGKVISTQKLFDGDLLSRGWTSISDCVLMQFTGLKDKNGKEIYESDILIDKEVDEYGNDISGYLPVIFCQNTGQWCVDNSFKKDGSHLVNIVEYLGIENLEVVGNIYENPLVLENENRVI